MCSHIVFLPMHIGYSEHNTNIVVNSLLCGIVFTDPQTSAS